MTDEIRDLKARVAELERSLFELTQALVRERVERRREGQAAVESLIG
jgi:hypothetical protein